MPRGRRGRADSPDATQGDLGLSLTGAAEGQARATLAVERVRAKYPLTAQQLHLHLVRLWWERRDRYARVLTLNPPRVSGDDAIEWLDGLGFGGDYRVVGAVFRRAGWLKRGHAPSRHPRRHGRELVQWTWTGGRPEEEP